MRSIVAISCFCFFALGLYAQQQTANGVSRKGILPVTANQTKETGVTRAVIVGISVYQNSKITDLKFADKDAKAFASYLRSKDGPAVDSANVTLLLNEKATSGQVAIALYSLMEESKEGDLAIIYFSGHADVESKTLNQPGFLLCWDAPHRAYMGGGTVGLSYFQEVISTMSDVSKAKVLVITDACRPGTLAGSSTGGTQATASNLAKQYANEVKIMSRLVDESSLESKASGGGRSVFSYYLIAGMQGLADQNNDKHVTLAEIERYINDKVHFAVAPHSEIPMTSGDKNSIISRVNPEVLAQLKQMDSESGFSTTGQKSTAFGISGSNDSVLLKKVAAFNRALTAGQLVEPQSLAAWTILQEIKNVPEQGKSIGLMKRNLAAALQDEAQQAINKYLQGDFEELKKRLSLDPKYEKYPDYLEKASSLLGESHFFYQTLIARAHYFKGLNYRLRGEQEKIDSLLILAMVQQEESLKMEPNAAHVLNEIGYILYLQKKYLPSIEFFKRSFALAPKWALPWSNMNSSFNALEQYDSAIEAGKKAIEADSLFMLSYYNLATTFYFKNDFVRAKSLYLHCIHLDATHAMSYFAMAEVCFRQNQLSESITWRKKGLKYAPNDIQELNALGYVLLNNNNPTEALEYYSKAKAVKPTTTYSFQGMIEYYFYTKDLPKAEQELRSYLEQYPKDNYAYYLLASIAIQTARPADCKNYLEQAFKLGFKDLDAIQKDDTFKSFVEGAEYKKLVKQCFQK